MSSMSSMSAVPTPDYMSLETDESRELKLDQLFDSIRKSISSSSPMVADSRTAKLINAMSDVRSTTHAKPKSRLSVVITKEKSRSSSRISSPRNVSPHKYCDTPRSHRTTSPRYFESLSAPRSRGRSKHRESRERSSRLKEIRELSPIAVHESKLRTLKLQNASNKTLLNYWQKHKLYKFNNMRITRYAPTVEALIQFEDMDILRIVNQNKLKSRSLDYAIAYGNLEIVKYITTYVPVSTEKLMDAIRIGDLPIVRHLNNRAHRNANMCIELALRYGHKHIAQFFRMLI